MAHEPGARRGESDHVILSSMPYAVERRVIVEKIAEAIIKKKLPPLLDVRDESTEETRVVLESGKPVLGVCFGHQLFVQALGGRVEFNSRGVEVGTIEVHHEADGEALFHGLPATIEVNASVRCSTEASLS